MESLKPARVEEILSRFPGVRVLVVGDLMLDVYLRGSVSRVSPEAPVPVVNVREEWRALGGAGNVAANVVALGAGCAVVGCVGTDGAGDAVIAALERAGIGGEGVRRLADRPTTVKTRIMARHQQVARYDRERTDDVDDRCAAGLADAIDEAAADADVIVLEDYDKGVLVPAVIEAALAAGGEADRPVVVDPKARRFFDYGGATVFKPNRTELEAALGVPVRAEDASWLEDVRRRLRCGHLLVTLGGDGMALRAGTGEHARLPAFARSVYDVSGAGDTVTAVVAVALAAGAEIEEAAMLANHAAAAEVGKAGVATVSADELRTTVGTRGAPAGR
ncbi:MAG: bifunctional heptose 7-phosphate kinase/heptose 1-phosphate adenyltransferase [Gemmatimonadota bacterium]